MATALFVCLHNAGRSQMSAALFERAAGGRHRGISAGTTPADRVHPEVVAVMREPGFEIDLSDRVPQLLTTALAEQADVVVTMGCGDACPYIPGTRYIDWQLTDPKGLPADEVRRIRDDIADRVNALVRELDDADAGSSAMPHSGAPSGENVVARCARCGAEYDPAATDAPTPPRGGAAPDAPADADVAARCTFCGAQRPVPGTTSPE
jgi:protein-tyrosine-phosphatase